MTCCNNERTEMTYHEPSGISQRAMQKWIRAPSPPVQIQPVLKTPYTLLNPATTAPEPPAKISMLPFPPSPFKNIQKMKKNNIQKTT